MTAHVPSLERCQRLKELGMPQETMFSWYLIKEPHTNAHGHCYFIDKWELGVPRRLIKDHSWFAAPIVTEILNWLPPTIGADDLIMQKLDSRFEDIERYIATYEAFELTTLPSSNAPNMKRDTLPNALADLLIWCVEQGHVKFEERKQ